MFISFFFTSLHSYLFGGANPFPARKEYLREVSYLIYILLENKHCAQSVSCVQLFCDPVNCSLASSFVHGFSRQEYWSGLLFPPPGHLSHPGIKPPCLVSPALVEDSLPLGHLGGPIEKKCSVTTSNNLNSLISVIFCSLTKS